jgi:hypothetical protein
MKLDGSQLLSSLNTAKWLTAAQTYGNDHSTLIGILIDWWISLDPQRHWALEGGPTNGYRQRGIRGQCDALLCRDNDPVGVVEVEGSRYKLTARKIGNFFRAKYQDLQTLQFGVLLLYSYQAQGRGEARAYSSVASSDAIGEVKKITVAHQGKSVIIITLDKTYRKISSGIRSRNEYYRGDPSKIEGRLYTDGAEKHCILFYNLTTN